MDKEILNATTKKIAIIGGGPTALFTYKRLIEFENHPIEISIFEKKSNLGFGMPYSAEGANDEHVTNVSDNEIPTIVTSIADWVQTVSKDILDRFFIDPSRFNEYKVLPRLFFGMYLEAQFTLLQEIANKKGFITKIHLQTTVVDVKETNATSIEVISETESFTDFDFAILCMGHNWPKTHEGKIAGYYDSPYPPKKLQQKLNHSVAIKGSSLTAIDAIRTITRANGTFEKDKNNILKYSVGNESPNFKIVIHSRSGMLPAVRFHLSDSHLSNDSLLSEEEITDHIKNNNGFLSLDYIFEEDFKKPIFEHDVEFYNRIKNLTLEEFVEEMMVLRETLEPFQLLKAEYTEAEKSIKRHESVYWKEMLAVLSFAMNHPAKHLSAEDMLRLQKTLAPLISIVIAFVPQSSCEELMALYNAGILEIISVGSDSYVEPNKNRGATYHYSDENNIEKAVSYDTFIDCVGQPHLNYKDFPFKSLTKQGIISPAQLKFSNPNSGKMAYENNPEIIEKVDDENFYLNVSGIAINDNFQVLNRAGAFNHKFYVLAVPYIGGFNPDYSGLDFSEAASLKVVKAINSLIEK